METLIKNPLTSMILVFRFCYMSSVRSTSDGRGPVTRKRVPDREEPGKPRKDARRGCCHPLEAGFWTLWMTPLRRKTITEYRIQNKLERARCWRRAAAVPRRRGLSRRRPVGQAQQQRQPQPRAAATMAPGRCASPFGLSRGKRSCPGSTKVWVGAQ